MKRGSGGQRAEHADGFSALPQRNRISSKVSQPSQPAPSMAFSAATATSGKKKFGAKGNIDISFSNMPIRSTLSVLADFSGNKLVADAAIDGSSSFNYPGALWTDVLRYVGKRHNLAIKVENGPIFALEK